MKVIAHRANIDGPNPQTENSPSQIKYAISKNYDCEIDLWYTDDKLYLGHDFPQYNIDLSFLLNNSNKIDIYTLACYLSENCCWFNLKSNERRKTTWVNILSMEKS